MNGAVAPALRFDGEFLRKLEFLRIVSRKAFAGRDRADRIARARGRGAEFADYRPYVAGDDIRQIDWKAYKRLNRLLLRLFDEERDLPIYLFLDSSRSMAIAGKFDLARRVAAALCYIGLVHLDRVTIASFSTHMAPEIVPGRGRSRIFGLLDRLDALEPEGETDLFRTVRGFAGRSRARGVAVVISDFLDPNGVEPSLRMLSALGHDVFVVHVQTARDGDVSPMGEVRIVDVESGESRDIDLTPALVASYRDAWRRQVDALKDVCGRYRLAYLPAHVEDPFEDVVLRAFRAGGFLVSPADLALWPALLLVGAVLGAAVWAFFVKTRPPRLAAPSLAIWRRVLDNPRERTWWDRIRRAVSLALTAMVALLLILSAVRPSRRSGEHAGRLTIVFDSSWSMGAKTSDGRTRWAHAVDEARALAASAGADEVTLETTGQGVVEGPTADRALIALAFDRLRTEGGHRGLELARGGPEAAVHFFTDGSFDRPIPPGVVVHSVFEAVPNVAVTAFSARGATSARGTPQAFLEIANMAPAQRVRLTMTREAIVVIDRQVEMKAGEIVREVVPLPGNGARLRVRINGADDALAADDEAVAWLNSAEPLRVTVVSDHPESFARLLARDPSIQPTFMRPSEWRTATPDVWIFDGWLPPEAPTKPALYFDPPAAGWLGVEVRQEIAPVWSGADAHPVLDGVDPVTVDVARARMPAGPLLRPIGTSARGTPLVSLIDSVTTRAVVVGFGMASSNLGSAPAFPVLVGNAIDWLAHPVSSVSTAAGAIELPPGTASVLGPDGLPLSLNRAPDRVLARLDQPGFYFVTAGGAHSVLALNAGDAASADLRRTHLPSTALRSATGAVSSRPWWMFGVAAAFALLMLEWWTWQRRVTV